nr:MAG TPA: hypothetical protein [Caudoviricetes sp.]
MKEGLFMLFIITQIKTFFQEIYKKERRILL